MQSMQVFSLPLSLSLFSEAQYFLLTLYNQNFLYIDIVLKYLVFEHIRIYIWNIVLEIENLQFNNISLKLYLTQLAFEKLKNETVRILNSNNDLNISQSQILKGIYQDVRENSE